MNIKHKKTKSISTVGNAAAITLSALAFLTLAPIAEASNLVSNGGFESTSSGPGQFDFHTIATGWTSAGNSYNFIFASGTADTTGALGQYGNLKLWGPNDGSLNGLPASSPDGGNFVAADGAFQVGAITQTINGLTPGAAYILSFYWAGAQQSGFTGATTDQWKVSFGGQTQSTAVVLDPNHGFTGWTKQTLNFTANGTSDLLSFLAVGTPNGEPPFALLDGVSLNSAPEPGSCALMLGGLVAALAAMRSKRLKR